jgi:hypothetical protein
MSALVYVVLSCPSRGLTYEPNLPVRSSTKIYINYSQFLNRNWPEGLIRGTHNDFSIHYKYSTVMIFKPPLKFILYLEGEVKRIKLSLCLAKHHAMNTYWESGGTVPRIYDLDTRCR